MDVIRKNVNKIILKKLVEPEDHFLCYLTYSNSQVMVIGLKNELVTVMTLGKSEASRESLQFQESVSLLNSQYILDVVKTAKWRLFLNLILFTNN